MSVDILQGPTTPNVTKTNLVYTLSSSNANNPQYRYVTDIYESGSSNYITTIKTYPNLSGNGILDIGRNLDDQLEYDLNWNTAGITNSVQSTNTFDIRFGEEYSDSLSGSITVYTGSVANYLTVIPGEVYKNEGSYNFPSSSFVDLNPPNNHEDIILSNDPLKLWAERQVLPDQGPGTFDVYKPIAVDDYETDTLFNNFAGEYIVKYNLQIFNYGTLVDSFNDTVTLGSSINTVVLGSGPQNLIDYSSSLQSAFDGNWTHYIVGVSYFPAKGNIVFYINDKLTQSEVDNISYAGVTAGTILPLNSCNEKTRFAFINQYGFWDYYNVYNPLRSNNQVDRSIYERSFVRYEDSIGSYNISNRGNTQYRTEYDKRYITTTDFINKETSQWLTELFESPEVFIQQNGNFVPINITNTNVRWNMNTSREKLFQYDIEFKYANQPQPR